MLSVLIPSQEGVADSAGKVAYDIGFRSQLAHDRLVSRVNLNCQQSAGPEQAKSLREHHCDNISSFWPSIKCQPWLSADVALKSSQPPGRHVWRVGDEEVESSAQP